MREPQRDMSLAGLEFSGAYLRRVPGSGAWLSVPNFGRAIIDDGLAFRRYCCQEKPLPVESPGEAESRGRAGDSVSDVLRSLPLDQYQSLSLDEFPDKEWERERFDCILISDSLEYASNVDVVLAAVKRLLRPGGIVLAILPGLQNGHRQRGIKNLHWHFTTHSASAIFERYFGRENIQVIGSGNILVAVGALHGLVVEELSIQDLETHDPAYEVSMFVRAFNGGANEMGILA